MQTCPKFHFIFNKIMLSANFIIPIVIIIIKIIENMCIFNSYYKQAIDPCGKREMAWVNNFVLRLLLVSSFLFASLILLHFPLCWSISKSTTYYTKVVSICSSSFSQDKIHILLNISYNAHSHKKKSPSFHFSLELLLYSMQCYLFHPIF